MLTMMAELASLEKELIAERRTAGIKCAQLERKHCGRPIKATAEQVRKLCETFALLRMCDEMNVRGSLPPPHSYNHLPAFADWINISMVKSGTSTGSGFLNGFHEKLTSG